MIISFVNTISTYVSIDIIRKDLLVIDDERQLLVECGHSRRHAAASTLSSSPRARLQIRMTIVAWWSPASIASVTILVDCMSKSKLRLNTKPFKQDNHRQSENQRLRKRKDEQETTTTVSMDRGDNTQASTGETDDATRD